MFTIIHTLNVLRNSQRRGCLGVIVDMLYGSAKTNPLYRGREAQFFTRKGASEKTPIPPFVPRRPIISRCHRSVPGSWPRGTRGGVVPTDRQQIFPPSSEHQRPLTAVQRQHTSRHVHKRFYAIVKTKTAEDSRTPPNGP